MKPLSTFLLSLLFGTFGCWVPKGVGESMQQDIRLLQEQQLASQKSLGEQQARLEEQMQRADRKIEEVARMLEDLNRASRSTNADYGVQLERLGKDLQELRGAFELSDYRVQKFEGKLEGEGSLEARVLELEKRFIEAPVKDVTSKNKKDLLASALELQKQGKAGEARGIWREVAKSWPNETGITDEAFYRIGETYLDEKKYRNALNEYVKVVEKFASGIWADRAYYKIGLCSMSLGNYEDAKIFFGEITRNYKKSSLVKDAQKKIEEVQSRLDAEAKGKSKAKGK